jgi:hypothetical protein
MRKLLLVALLLSNVSHAESDKVQHFLVSAGITSVTYITFSRVLRLEPKDRWKALLVSVVASSVAGLAVEAMDSMDRRDRRIDGGDMLANGLGNAAAAGLIIAIDF